MHAEGETSVRIYTENRLITYLTNKGIPYRHEQNLMANKSIALIKELFFGGKKPKANGRRIRTPTNMRDKKNKLKGNALEQSKQQSLINEAVSEPC